MISIFHIPYVHWIQYVISNCSPSKKINCHIYSSYWKIIPVTTWSILICARRPCCFSYYLVYTLTVLQTSEQTDERKNNETPWNASYIRVYVVSKCHFIRQFRIFLFIVFSVLSMLAWFEPFLCRCGSVQPSYGDVITGTNLDCGLFNDAVSSSDYIVLKQDNRATSHACNGMDVDLSHQLHSTVFL